MIDIFKTTTLDNLIAFSLGMFMASVIYYIIRLWTIEMPWAERTYDISKKKLEKFEDCSKQTIRQLDKDDKMLYDPFIRDLVHLNRYGARNISPGMIKGTVHKSDGEYTISSYDDFLDEVGGKK